MERAMLALLSLLVLSTTPVKSQVPIIITTSTESTSTTSTTTTTTNDFYVGCGVSKGCAGAPQGCVNAKNCTMAVSYYAVSVDLYQMEITGDIRGRQEYVAVGLSTGDAGMGNDSVMACLPMLNQVEMSWNGPDYNIRLGNPSLGLSFIDVDIVDGHGRCKFKRKASIRIPLPPSEGVDFVDSDLNSDHYHFLFARGMHSESNVQLLYHGTDRFADNRSVYFGDYNEFLLAHRIYRGCGRSKGCLGYPKRCVDALNCSALLTYAGESEGEYRMELMGFREDYVAFALSLDSTLGSDSLVACSRSFLKRYWYGEDQASPIFDPMLGLTIMTLSNEANYTYCSFVHDASVDTTVKLDLNGVPYHVLLAQGDVRGTDIVFQVDADLVTDRPVLLSDYNWFYVVVDDDDDDDDDDGTLEIKLHGCFMVVAWYLMGSLGIFAGRHCRRRLFRGKDAWFSIHRACMSLTWLLGVTAFIIIVAKFGLRPLEWARVERNPHAVLGFLSFVLMFIQPFLAMLRCHPGDRHRPLFNWLHRCVGFSAITAAMTAVILAADASFDPFPMRSGSQEIAAVYVGFFFVWNVGLSCCRGGEDTEDEGGEVDRVVAVGAVTYLVGSFAMTVAMVVKIATS